MANFWRGKKQTEEFDDWEYPFEEEKNDHMQIKQCIVAVILFCSVYGLKSSGTFTGDYVEQHIHRLVTEQTDFAYLAERVQRYLPEEWRGTILERAQEVLSRPADPRYYQDVSAVSEDAPPARPEEGGQP